MDQFIGSWKLVSAENMEMYLQALGVGDELSEIIQIVKPTLNISQDGDIVSFEIQTIVCNQTFSFQLGEEFDKERADGRDCKVTVSLEDDKLIEVSKWAEEQSCSLYEVKDGLLIKTITYQDITSVRTFEKV